LLVDLAKCDGSGEPLLESLREQRTLVRDYGEVAHDWNYVAATICAESAFNFHSGRQLKIYCH
jgi:hypothetical protein